MSQSSQMLASKVTLEAENSDHRTEYSSQNNSSIYFPGNSRHGQGRPHVDDHEPRTVVLEPIAAQRGVAPDEARRRQDDGQGSRNRRQLGR